jgi:hypothetical protein
MRRGLVMLGIVLAVISASGWPAPPRSPAFRPIRDPADPRLAGLTQAIESWNRQQAPRRDVVDAVVLVPDVDTFLKALTAWTPRRFFPVLIEEPESTLRFVRAFRPARIVRLHSVLGTMSEEGTDRWQAALRAMAAACSKGQRFPDAKGEAVIPDSSLRSPGLVLTSADSPALSGAVALAAGRFQGLANCVSHIDAARPLSELEAVNLSGQVTRLVQGLFPRFDRLGDDLDFLTVALPWPDRFLVGKPAGTGPYALDDLIGRIGPAARRYAFVGRLTNTPAASAYQAMCSLFLQPDNMLLFNGYGTGGLPWGDFEMGSAAGALGSLGRVLLCEGTGEATRNAWHRALDPVSDYGLVLVNSSGSPVRFQLEDGSAETRDIPWTRPAAVLYIHSFSAARPDDSATIAGRWLANGAFLYFGAIEEPYLQAFRTPHMVSQLLARGVPIAAAVHKIAGEDVFGGPWRLCLIGDPLYRLEPREARRKPRIPSSFAEDFEPIRSAADPVREADGPARLRTCWDAALLNAGASIDQVDDLADRLASIPRATLSAAERSIYETLLAELVVRADPAQWQSLIESIPESDRGGTLRRAVEARSAGDAILDRAQH